MPGKQLPLFKINCSTFGYIFQYGKIDFCLFNPMRIKLREEKLTIEKINLIENKFWNKIKSYTWSANCDVFVVVNENELIIGKPQTDSAFKCNLSISAIRLITEQKSI